jgi:hypothetical protein
MLLGTIIVGLMLGELAIAIDLFGADALVGSDMTEVLSSPGPQMVWPMMPPHRPANAQGTAHWTVGQWHCSTTIYYFDIAPLVRELRWCELSPEPSLVPGSWADAPRDLRIGW